jgi:hypothetical protein
MKDLLLKAKLLLTELWGRLQPLWTSLLSRWNALLVHLSTVDIPFLKKKLSPRTIGISIVVLIAIIALVVVAAIATIAVAILRIFV